MSFALNEQPRSISRNEPSTISLRDWENRRLEALIFSKEVWEEQVLNNLDQLKWAHKNMRRCEYGTVEHNRWFSLLVRIGLRIIEMKENAKLAPSELNKKATREQLMA